MCSTVFLVILSLFFSQSLCAECSNQPLGMEDGVILDFQITASSEYSIKTRAANGRLNFVATKDRTGAWSAKTKDVNQWLQVDLLGQAEISEIQTQGREDCCNQFVTTFTISYSHDGTTFTNYTQDTRRVKVFPGNSDMVSVVSNVLSPAITARFIRVHPKSWNQHISMRIELVGCRTEMDFESCVSMAVRGYCSTPFFQAQCPKVCLSICSNYMRDAGCSFMKQLGRCKDLFPLCRKTCTRCDIPYESLGCFIDKNRDRIMNAVLHIDFADPDIVNVCSQKAAARGYSVFGVEAGGECFSGPNAELTFKKHGQAPDGDCADGKGNNHRMSVYKFGITFLTVQDMNTCKFFTSTGIVF